MLFALRYVVPALMVVAGLITLVAAPDSWRYDGFGLWWGAAFALFVFAQLVRLNTSGSGDRDREEAARDYYTKHGRWEEDDD